MLGLFGVAFVIGKQAPYPFWFIFLLGTSSIFEAVFIKFLLSKNHFSPLFLSKLDIYHLYIWGILIVPCINALIGTSLFLLNGYIQYSEWSVTLFDWWLGNSMGVLIILPMALVWTYYPLIYYKLRIRKLVEILIISIVVSYILLSSTFQDRQLHLFVSFLIIIFCSIRYLHHGATLIALVISLTILIQNRNVNVDDPGFELIFNHEIFIALIYMTGLYIATVLKKNLEIQNSYFTEKIYAETILNSIYDSVIVTNADGIVISVNPSAERLLGKSELELKGTAINNAFRLKLESTKECINEQLMEGIKLNVRNIPEKDLLMDTDGYTHNVEIYLSPVDIKQQNTSFIFSEYSFRLKGCAMTIRNVNQSHQLKKQLRFQAGHDYLTGLLNRRDFEGKLTQIIKSKFDQKIQHVLLFIDLDRFKVVNDTSGHVAGDQILRSASKILQKALRKNDLLARIGGDEFGVLLTDCKKEKGLEIAECLRKAIVQHQFKWDENQFNLSASIGLSVINQSTESMKSVMREADIACYEAKDSGKNTVFVYKGSENSKRETDMLWLSRIIKAIDKRQFELYVQPIVMCDTLSISHYEVLLRLKLEDDGMISPAVFIPAAERHGAMPKVDKWVVDSAIKWLQENKSKNIRLAINLSGASLGDEDFCEYLKDKIANSNLSPKQLCFEITETSAIKNYDIAKYLIKCSKEYGVSFALDDFGSGLSSFAYLKSFPVDYLKIDGSFVKEMADNPIDRAMVKSIHEVGKVMGIKTIAEFVENDAIIKECQSLGIDMLQGYGIEKPKPLKDI